MNSLLVFTFVFSLNRVRRVEGKLNFVTSPSVIIQNQQANFTCTDPGIVSFIRGNLTVANCFISLSCTFSSDADNHWSSVYTLSQNGNDITVGITSVSRNRDGGSWTCRGTGGITQTINIDVKVAVPSVVISKGLTFTDGQITMATCQIGESHPPPGVTWLIDSITQPSTSITTNLNSDGTTTSIFNYLVDKYDNTKTLYCTADNNIGNPRSDSKKLDIKFPVTSVTIKNMNNIEFIDGRRTPVTCQIGKANPSATITWTIDSITQPSTSITTNLNSDGTTTSIFNYLVDKSDNTKTLYCTADNNIGNPRTDSKKLDIKYLDPMVIFTDKAKVEEGSRINITCSTNSYPVASISWYKDGQILKVNLTNKDSYINEKALCLDTSDYSCTASNTAIKTSVSKSLSLVIKCSPRQDPRVTSIRTVTGNITQIVYLVADVISYPPPSFTWYYIDDNMVIYISNKNPFKQIDTTISTNTYKSTLTINITSKLLYRTYRVNVSNADGGFKILDYNLILQSRPDPPYKPRIQSHSNNQICVEWKPGFNGGATQTFIVQHSTDDNTWVDSSPIPDRNDGQLIQYCITDLEPETQYYVRITAKNIVGESQIEYFHNIVKTTGQKVTSVESEEYSKGRASGMSSGIGIGIGISVAVVLLVLVAFYIYRRLITGKQKGTNADENYSTLNRGTASGEPPTYQELNDIRTYENLGVDTNIGTDTNLDPYINTGNT